MAQHSHIDEAEGLGFGAGVWVKSFAAFVLDFARAHGNPWVDHDSGTDPILPRVGEDSWREAQTCREATRGVEQVPYEDLSTPQLARTCSLLTR
jgi:hypothetical protein